MLKTKQRRLALVVVVMFSLITMYGGMPAVNAASMDSLKVSLSDSDLGALNTVTVAFKPGSALTAGQYVKVNFETGFTTVDTAVTTCPSDATDGGSGQDITCTVVTPLTDATTTITIVGVTNPGSFGDYSVTVSTHDVGGAELKISESKVYIIDDVTVTAHVAASLTFAVTGVATTTTINGDATTGSTSPTEIAFKTLAVDTEQRMAQQLSVSTNADAGYTVTVQQDTNMISDAGADIDSFTTGAPTPWVSPSTTVDLDDENTFGYMGVASDDSDLTTAFTDGSYQGLNGTTPLEVMSHIGPADGTTVDKGLANVMYNIEITDLQEAGDYENTLTYICTPTF